MLKRILMAFSDKSRCAFSLADILASEDNQETFLSVKKVSPPTPEQIKRDVHRVINYSRTEDYSIWAKEAWFEVLKCIDKLSDPALGSTEVDFYRGALRQAIDLLKISYRAHTMNEQISNDQKNVRDGSV